MEWISMRRIAALGAAMLLIAASVPVRAAEQRWAPLKSVEDGAVTADEEGPPGVPAVTEPTKPQQPGENQPGKAQKQEDPKGKAPGNPSKGGAHVSIKSPSAVLIEAQSGRVLFEQSAHERRNPASVTKIMTLIVAFDAIRDGKAKMIDKVTISAEASKQPGTTIFADDGETFSLAELLKSVAVGSANDASVAVGEHVAGSVEAFVQQMNAKAKELGMQDTQFQNPTGLSAEGHFTSAYDIALMSRYAAINYPELMKLTAVYGADLAVPWRKNGPTFRLWNNNKLLTWFTGADGLKTGWTQAAGYCLAATAVRDGVRMISVIMGADDWKQRNAEAAKLLEYGFSNYTSVTLAPQGKKVDTVRVTRGKAPQVDVVPQGLFAVGVAKGEQKKVKMEVSLKRQVEAPISSGQVVGELIATLDGKEIGRMPLVAAQEVPKANMWEMLVYQLRSVFTLQ